MPSLRLTTRSRSKIVYTITQHNAKEEELNMALLKAQFTEDVFTEGALLQQVIFE
jgi:hypothetical protein